MVVDYGKIVSTNTENSVAIYQCDMSVASVQNLIELIEVCYPTSIVSAGLCSPEAGPLQTEDAQRLSVFEHRFFVVLKKYGGSVLLATLNVRHHT